jgi:hypothetical protein
MRNPDAPGPEGGRGTRFSPKAIDLVLNSDGTGHVNYVVEVGSSGFRPDMSSAFRIEFWDGAKLSGTWASEGATGIIRIAPAGDKIILDWRKAFDRGQRFATAGGTNTLVRR